MPGPALTARGISGAGPGSGGEDPGFLDPIVVEWRDDSGDNSYSDADWLGSEFSVTWPTNGIPTARLEVTLKSGFGVNLGSDDNPDVRPLDELVDDGKIFAIRTARSDGSDFWLFEGRVDRVVRSAGLESKTATLHLSHIADELRAGGIYVRGQFWLTKDDFEKLLENKLHKPTPRVVGSLDCIFNPLGKANGRGYPVLLSDRDQGDDGTFPLTLFTFTEDPDAQKWNWARVLTYLLFVARGGNDEGGLGDFTIHRFLPPVITTGRGDVEDLVAFCLDRNYLTVDPDETGNAADPFDLAFASAPFSHALEGRNWQEALDWTCMRMGLGYFWESVRNSGAGSGYGGPGTRSGWRLHFFLAGVAPGNELRMASPAYRTHNKDWEQVQRETDVTNLSLEENWAAAVNRVVVQGGPQIREITTQLVPLWPQNADWDVDPKDKEAQKKALEFAGNHDGDFDKRYVLARGDHFAAAQTSVGRLWGINTIGKYDDFWRKKQTGEKLGPWRPERQEHFERNDPEWSRYPGYGILDLAWWRIADSNELGAGAQSAVRPRKFEACLTLDKRTGKPLAPTTEVSWDGGKKWYFLQGNVWVSEVDLQIYLKQADLRDLAEPGGTENFATAYIKGLLHVRITAGIKIEQPLEAVVFDDTGRSRSQRVRAVMVSRRDAMLRNDREGNKQDDKDSDAAMGNSIFNERLAELYSDTRVGYKQVKRDDRTAAKGYARRMMRLADRVSSSGPVNLPELVFPLDLGGGNKRGWQPGDTMAGVDGKDSAEHSINLRANYNEYGAVVAAVTWNYKLPGNGAGFGASTIIQLEDASRFVKFEGN